MGRTVQIEEGWFRNGTIDMAAEDIGKPKVADIPEQKTMKRKNSFATYSIANGVWSLATSFHS